MKKPENIQHGRELDSDEIRRVQLEILSSVDEFCRKNGISYFIFSGTLLGAVRHKGYIPWDDDIDIAMLRPDYDRFMESFNGSVQKLRVIDNEHESEFPYPFAKIERTDTLLVENDELTDIFPLGINIDLFVLDGRESREDAVFAIRKNSLLYKMLMVKNTSKRKGRALHREMLLKLLKIIAFPISRKKIIQTMVKRGRGELKKQYKSVNYYCNICFPMAGLTEIYPAKLFENHTELMFEGRNYWAPVGYDKWLSLRYGNYMELPPLSKQITHHNFKGYLR